jgi:hypothetical protein
LLTEGAFIIKILPSRAETADAGLDAIPVFLVEKIRKFGEKKFLK